MSNSVSLQTLAADGQLVSLTPTDTVSVAEFSSLSSLQITMLNAKIVDTAVNIELNIDALQSQYLALSSITMTDNGTPTLSFTVAQMVNDASVLGKICRPYSVTVSGTGNTSQNPAANNTVASIEALMSQGAEVTGFGQNQLGSNGYDIDMYNASNGQTITMEINSSGITTELQEYTSSSVTNPDGSKVVTTNFQYDQWSRQNMIDYYGTNGTLIAETEAVPGDTVMTLFVPGVSFRASGSTAATGTITNFENLVAAGATVESAGQNELGSGGYDVNMYNASNGQTIITEVNGSGATVALQEFTVSTLTNPDGSKVVATNFQHDQWNRTSMIDYSGTTGTLIAETDAMPTDTVMTLFVPGVSFRASGSTDAATTITNFETLVSQRVEVEGYGQNQLGSNGYDIDMYNASNGQTIITEVNGSGATVALQEFTVSTLTNPDGSKVVTTNFQHDQWNRTSMIDYYGTNGTLIAETDAMPTDTVMTLFVPGVSFRASGSGAAAITSFENFVAAGAAVELAGQNELGSGGYDVNMYNASKSQTTTMEINSSGVTTELQEFTSSSVTNSDGSKVVTTNFQYDQWSRQNMIDYYGTNGTLIAETEAVPGDTVMTLFVPGVSFRASGSTAATGTITNFETLVSQGAEVAGFGQNQLGSNGYDIDMHKTSTGQTIITELNNAGTTLKESFTAGTSNDTFSGGSGYNIYQFGASFGQDTINNGGGSATHGEVDFGAGISDENLWFQKSGNDLLITRLGSNEQIDIAGWYSATGNQVTNFMDTNGLKLDTQVAQLVQAMANYQSAHPSFNPGTAASMPSDATLQNTIASAWHH